LIPNITTSETGSATCNLDYIRVETAVDVLEEACLLNYGVCGPIFCTAGPADRTVQSTIDKADDRQIVHGSAKND
jgi:hypothetical protein